MIMLTFIMYVVVMNEERCMLIIVWKVSTGIAGWMREREYKEHN